MGTRLRRWGELLLAGAATAAVPVAARWLRRKATARRTVNLHMTLVIARPVSDVFEFCRDFANFPRILRDSVEVDDSQDGRSHWKVHAPTGVLEWDAVVTKYVPNNVLAWESVVGSPVRSAGLMRFSPLSTHETRLDVIFSYAPARTRLMDVVRVLMAPSNTARLRGELAHAPDALVGHTPPDLQERAASN